VANSFSFNGTDLSAYGLKLLNVNLPDFSQESHRQLIQDISYSFKPKRPPKVIQIDVVITGADRSTLEGYLDSIKSVIRTDAAYKLEIDFITDRYWNAKLDSITGAYNGPTFWGGMITFIADDSMAYDATETSSDHNIDADPDTIQETPGGTGYINPVYTLTAGEALNDVTIKVENLSTEEELQWIGSLGNGEELEIDVATWIVKKKGVASMSGLASTSKFPRLAPNQANSIKVTGFSTTGTLNIKYRDRYL